MTQKVADGTYLPYFPFAILTEEAKITPSNKKLLDIEGLRLITLRHRWNKSISRITKGDSYLKFVVSRKLKVLEVRLCLWRVHDRYYATKAA